DEVVPVRDLIVHRTAGVTVGNAAVHAARSLRARLALREREHELVPMLDAALDRFVAAIRALVLEKAGDLAHSLFGGLHRARLLHLGERTPIFERHHLAEFRAIALPPFKNLRGARRACELGVARDEIMQPLGVKPGLVLEGLE